MDWSCDQLGERERYRLLVNTVLPRPIAWSRPVTSRGA